MSRLKTMTGLLVVLLLVQLWISPGPVEGAKPKPKPALFTENDKDLIAVALNLEYMEAELFMYGAYGYGLDKQAPSLVAGGPPPYGGQKANLDKLTNDLVSQMGLQEVGHIRIIRESIGSTAFPRPQLNISKEAFAKAFDAAFNRTLSPPFDPYANSINYMLASYAVPYVGLTGYVGVIPRLVGAGAKRLVAGLLGVESGQDAIIRTWLYERKDEIVKPYSFTVAEATGEISKLRNDLDHRGLTVVAGKPAPYKIDDEGLVVPKELGAEGEVTGNILSADENSISYSRTPMQIFAIIYSTGNPKVPGGFYPEGARGKYAEMYHKYGA